MPLRVVNEVGIRLDRDADRPRGDLEIVARRSRGVVFVFRRERHAVFADADGGVILPLPERDVAARCGVIVGVHGREGHLLVADDRGRVLLRRAVILERRPEEGDVEIDRRRADRIDAGAFAVVLRGAREGDVVVLGVQPVARRVDIIGVACRRDGVALLRRGGEGEGHLSVVEGAARDRPGQFGDVLVIVALRVVDIDRDGALVDREEPVDRGHRIVGGLVRERRIDRISGFAHGVAGRIICLHGTDRKPGGKERGEVLAVRIAAGRDARLVRAVLVARESFGSGIAVGGGAVDGDGDRSLFDLDRDGTDHVVVVGGADLIPDGSAARVRKRRHRRPAFRVRVGLRAADDERPHGIRPVHRLRGETTGEGVVRVCVVRPRIACHAVEFDRCPCDRIFVCRGNAELVIVAPIADGRRKGVRARVDKVGFRAVRADDAHAQPESTVAVDARRRSERAALFRIQIIARVDEVVILRPSDILDRVFFDDEFVCGRESLLGLARGEGVVFVVDRERDGVAARGGSRVLPDVAVLARVRNFAVEDRRLLVVDEARNAPRRPVRAAVSAAVVGERRRQEGGRDGEGACKGLALRARVARPARDDEVGVGEGERDGVAARVFVVRDLEGDRRVEADAEGVARNSVRVVQTARKHFGSGVRAAAVGLALGDDIDLDLRFADRIFVREVAVGKPIIALLRLGEPRREGIAARVDKGFRRDALGQIERAVAVDARRRREGAVVLIFRVIGKGAVRPNDIPCPDRVFLDREGVLRRGAARKGVVRIADGRGDGVAARVELAVRIGVGSIGEGDLRILPVQRRGRVSDFDLPVAAEGAVDGVLGRHRDRDRDRVRVDVEVRRNVCGQRVVFRARARDLRDFGGVIARIRLRARDRQRDIVARHRARRLRRGSLRRTVVGEGGVRPGNADRLFRNGEGTALDVQDEVRRVDGNAVRPVRGDGVDARVMRIAGELRARGAIDEPQRASRDPVVHKAAVVGRVALDVGIFDGNFLPFAVRRIRPAHGHADRARRDREGDGFRLRRRVRASLADVTDDVVGADVGRHRVGHVLGAVRVGGVAEALFAARDVAADPGLMVGVLPVRPAVGVEHDLDDELRAGDLVADRDGRAALRQSIVHTRFADLRLQPRPLIIGGSEQGERRAVHAVVAGAHVPIDGINALIRVDDEVAAVVRRVRDETVVVVGVAVDPLRLAQDIVEVDRLLFDDKGERDVALRAVRPRIVGLVRDGDGDGVAALVGIRLHVAGDGQRLAALRQRVLFIALGHIGLLFAAVDKLALVRGRLVEPIARDGEVLRGVGRQLVVARARARDLRDFGGVVAGIRLPARDRQSDIVAATGTRRLRCGGLLFAAVGEGGVRPGNADLLLRDREGCRKAACAFERVVGVGNFVDRKSIAADVDRPAVRKRAARLRRHRAGEPDGVRDAVLRGEVGDRRCGVPCFPFIYMGQRPPLHFDHARADRKLPRCVCGQRVVVFARARDLRDFGGVAARIRLRARDRQSDAVAVIVVRRLRRRLMRRAVVHERSVRPADRKLERRDREGEFFYGRRLAVGVRIVRPLVVVAVREGQRDGVCIRIHPIAALRDVVQGTCRDVGGLRRAVVRLAVKRGDVDGLLGDRPGERLVRGLPVRPHEVGDIAEGGGDGVRPRIGRRQRAARKVGGRAARDREGDGRLDRKPGGRRPARKRGRLRAAAVCIAGVGEGRSGDLQFGDLVGDRQGVAADRVTFAADLLAPGRLVRVLDRKRRGVFARIGAARIRDGEIARIVLTRVGHGGGLRRARVRERGKRRRLQHALADRERGELFVLHRREATSRRDADGERVCTHLVGKVGCRPRAGRRAAARLAVRVGDVAAAVVVQKGEGDVVVAIPAELLAFIGAVAPFDTDRRLRGIEGVGQVEIGLVCFMILKIICFVRQRHAYRILARFRRLKRAGRGIIRRLHACRAAGVLNGHDLHDIRIKAADRDVLHGGRCGTVLCRICVCTGIGHIRSGIRYFQNFHERKIRTRRACFRIGDFQISAAGIIHKPRVLVAVFIRRALRRIRILDRTSAQRDRTHPARIHHLHGPVIVCIG